MRAPSTVSGPFRIDDFSLNGKQACARIKAKLGDWSGYVTLCTDSDGAGMACAENGQTILSPEQFTTDPSETPAQASARFAAAMLRAGFSPMFDMNNDICARAPEDLAKVKFEPRGHVGRYR